MPVTNSVAMEWLMEGEIDSRAQISLAKMTVAVGVTSDLHQHPNCTETIHVIAGEISQRIGEKWHTLSAGETCLIPIGKKHQTRNVGAKLAIMIIAYSAGRRDYVAVS